MRLFSREATNYAVLLIVLFSIATLAVWHTISYVEDHVPDKIFHVVTILISTITLGFMLIAGAFGLWAIQFSAEAEGRRRVGRLVDGMDYLPDVILAVDERGRVTGSNPAAHDMMNSPLSNHEALRSIFTCLSEADLALLLHKSTPNEVEREFNTDDSQRTLRFRSQPSEGLNLIFVSDVTTMHAQLRHRRQIARLQLIGQLSRGVAHDFNNLLCGISGYASLLERLPPGSPDIEKSLSEIRQGSERGIALASHLLELSQPAVAGHFTNVPADHVNAAVELLRDSLPPDWSVSADVSSSLPAVGLTGIQLEQVVLNLGLLTADGVTSPPTTIRIVMSRPDSTHHLLNVDSSFAVVILVTTTGAPEDTGDTVVMRPTTEVGAIEAVILSLLKEAGGGLDCLVGAHGSPIYRARLPQGIITSGKHEPEELPSELQAYVANWSVLLAGARKKLDPIEDRMRNAGIGISRVDNITSVLASIEDDPALDALILDEHLLGHEAKGLLRAILKLHPASGIVVLSDSADPEPEGLSKDIVFEQIGASPGRILMALVEAKGLAIRRRQS